MLNNIYGLAQPGRSLFNMFSDDKFEQSEADQRVFRKFYDGEVKIVVFMRMEDILAHAQATMERFFAELGETFKVKPMVEKFGVKKASRVPASCENDQFL